VSTFRTIVVAVDFSPNSHAALATAIRLANDLDAEVLAVHIVSRSALRTCIHEGLLTADDDDATIQAKVRAHVDQKFDSFMSSVGAAPDRVERFVLRGDPTHDLVAFLKERGGDLIVAGRRGETFSDVLLGSVSERLVRQAPCPVLIVKGE